MFRITLVIALIWLFGNTALFLWLYWKSKYGHDERGQDRYAERLLMQFIDPEVSS